MNENISVICSETPKERIPLLLNILKEYGIMQHKKVYVQSFDVKKDYYINHLISLIGKIDFKLVESYMFPIEVKSEKEKKINSKSFILALEKLRNSDITIKDNKEFKKVTWLNYVFDLASTLTYQVIIIDNFNEFLERSEESLECIMNRIEKYSKRYHAEIILFMNEMDYHKFLNWKVSKVNDPFEFNYDPHHHSILGIERKDENHDNKE